MAGRILAIGDIHGCDFALETLVQAAAPGAGDTVVVLGDVVDRGAGTKQAVDLLLQLRQTANLVCIRGNHEEMMLLAPRDRQWREAWLQFGGANTLCSYGGGFDSVPQSHWEFFRSTVDYFETPGWLFIHANLEPAVPLARQTQQWLRWTHLTGLESPLASGQTVVCGHTPQKSGMPLVLPGWVCLDTYACGTGWLSCLDVESGMIWQSNERRELRLLRLGDLAAESAQSGSPAAPTD